MCWYAGFDNSCDSPTADELSSLPLTWVEDPGAPGCVLVITPNAHHVHAATSPVQDALQACSTPDSNNFTHPGSLEKCSEGATRPTVLGPISPSQSMPQGTTGGKHVGRAEGKHHAGSARCVADCTQAAKAFAEAPLPVCGLVHQLALRRPRDAGLTHVDANITVA